MKAILVNDDRSLRWDEVPDPIIKSEEVLVEIHAAALNRADLMQREGEKEEEDDDYSGLRGKKTKKI